MVRIWTHRGTKDCDRYWYYMTAYDILRLAQKGTRGGATDEVGVVMSGRVRWRVCDDGIVIAT